MSLLIYSILMIVHNAASVPLQESEKIYSCFRDNDMQLFQSFWNGMHKYQGEEEIS